jgi:hypothetical protein
MLTRSAWLHVRYSVMRIRGLGPYIALILGKRLDWIGFVWQFGLVSLIDKMDQRTSSYNALVQHRAMEYFLLGPAPAW